MAHMSIDTVSGPFDPEGIQWQQVSMRLIPARYIAVLPWLVIPLLIALTFAVLIRKGVMFRSLVVVPYGRMQYVDVTAGPLARIFKIASVQLHTAAMGTDASIDGLTPAEAARLRDRLASRGEARLAGL